MDVEREGSVARIFLDRPEKANALQSGMLRVLAEAFRSLAGDETLRVVVLGGRGRTFCGGADTGELKSLNASSAGSFVEKIHQVCAAIRDLVLPGFSGLCYQLVV